MVVKDSRDLLIRVLAGTFAFETEEDGLAWVLLQELEHVVEEVAEVFVTGERDGEDAVDEDQSIVGGIEGRFGLQADVEEADAVLELDKWGYGLASDGG